MGRPWAESADTAALTGGIGDVASSTLRQHPSRNTPCNCFRQKERYPTAYLCRRFLGRRIYRLLSGISRKVAFGPGCEACSAVANTVKSETLNGTSCPAGFASRDRGGQGFASGAVFFLNVSAVTWRERATMTCCQEALIGEVSDRAPGRITRYSDEALDPALSSISVRVADDPLRASVGG